MDLLNELLNQSLKTTGKNYTQSKDNIYQCFKAFSNYSLNDDITLDVSMYFFPFCSTVEKNEDSFWFVKYKNDNIYDEFDFAIDLIKAYILYTSDKVPKLFESRMKETVRKFGSYKNIPDFLSAIDRYQALIAYLTQDRIYFNNLLELKTLPLNIQSAEFISDLKTLLNSKKEHLELLKKIKTLQNYMMQNRTIIENLESNMINLTSQITSLNGRIGKNDVRDTENEF